VVGGLALHVLAVTQFGWIGAGCTLLALAVLALSIRFGERPAAQGAAGGRYDADCADSKGGD